MLEQVAIKQDLLTLTDLSHENLGLALHPVNLGYSAGISL
jgi:hypothetical protein